MNRADRSADTQSTESMQQSWRRGQLGKPGGHASWLASLATILLRAAVWRVVEAVRCPRRDDVAFWRPAIEFREFEALLRACDGGRARFQSRQFQSQADGFSAHAIENQSQSRSRRIEAAESKPQMRDIFLDDEEPEGRKMPNSPLLPTWPSPTLSPRGRTPKSLGHVLSRHGLVSPQKGC